MTSRLVLLAFVALGVSPAAAEPPDPIRLRVGTLAIDGSRYMKDILALGKEIEHRTRGRVQLDWVSGGQLGDEAAVADLITRGKLDGGGFSETGLRALVPEMAAWGAPGLFRGYEEVDRATAAVETTVRDLFAKRSLTFAMWADLGFSHLFSVEPITHDTVEQAAPWLEMPIDGKLTDAILGGRARTWTLPPLYMLAIGSGVAHYTTSHRYRYVVGGLVLAGPAWARLGESDQAIVLATCREWEPRIRASWRKESERGIAVLEKAGVKTSAVSLTAAPKQVSESPLGAAIASAIAR